MSVSFMIVDSTNKLVKNVVEEWFDGDLFQVNTLELNVSNTNACVIANLLGFGPIEDGYIEITDVARLEQRCREELAVLHSAPELDRGRVSKEWPREPGKVTVIECARSDGYFTQRLEELRKLAEYCLLNVEGGKIIGI